MSLVLYQVGCKSTGRIPDPSEFNSIIFQDLQGQTISLADYPDDVVLVTFFATWCAPCLAEIPLLNRLHALPGVRVIAISLDQQARKFLPLFVEQFDPQYPVIIANEDLREGRSPFGLIPAIPAAFLFDSRRRLVATMVGPLSAERLDPLLKKAGAHAPLAFSR